LAAKDFRPQLAFINTCQVVNTQAVVDECIVLFSTSQTIALLQALDEALRLAWHFSYRNSSTKPFASDASSSFF